MADIWTQEATVTTMHPIGGREVGWNAVRESFEKVGQISTSGEVALKDQLIRVDGNMAYEIGVEQGQLKLAGQRANIEHRVTNVYQRVGGAWKIVHHHTDTSPALLEICRPTAAAVGDGRHLRITAPASAPRPRAPAR
jgi:ketosteroid isomerase-like protein